MLTWDELALTATCRGETMRWHAKHDAIVQGSVAALRERARPPLALPGKEVWIEYAYSVREEKWGRW